MTQPLVGCLDRISSRLRTCRLRVDGGRGGEAGEVASAMLFLAGNANLITGAPLLVDG